MTFFKTQGEVCENNMPIHLNNAHCLMYHVDFPHSNFHHTLPFKSQQETREAPLFQLMLDLMYQLFRYRKTFLIIHPDATSPNSPELCECFLQVVVLSDF